MSRDITQGAGTPTHEGTPKGGETSSDARNRLLVDLSIQEQGWYWSRFTAFSAMHAALFVLLSVGDSSESTGRANGLIAGAGLVLSLAWMYIQAISLWYVKRYKRAFRALLHDAGLGSKRPKYFPVSSTEVGAGVAASVGLLWVLLIAQMYWR